jgi:hypothetical protein
VWIPKPGKDRHYIQNLRPITLIHPMAKTMYNWLQSHTNEFLARTWNHTTYGANPHKSTIQALYTIEATRQQLKAHKESYLLYLSDLSQAFDNADRCQALELFSTMNLPPELLSIHRAKLTHTNNITYSLYYANTTIRCSLCIVYIH